MYLLPKIHKRLENVPGRPVISNCGTPTEKVSEFLDYHLKPVICGQSGRFYIKDSGDFLKKIKHLVSFPENAILVTPDVVGLYPSIVHDAGLQAHEEALENRNHKQISTGKLVKMAQFVLKNNFFEFSNYVFQYISVTAIETQFAPPYACIFIIFVIWTHVEEKLEEFLVDFNAFNPDIQFT